VGVKWTSQNSHSALEEVPPACGYVQVLIQQTSQH